MNPQTAPNTLSYSCPRCFFEAEYRYRSWQSWLGIAVLLVMTAFALFMVSKSPGAGGRLSLVLRAVGGVMVAACGLAAGWLLLGLVTDRRDLVRITDEGIEHGRRLHPWQSIASVGAAAVTGGVVLEYWLKPGPLGVTPLDLRSINRTPLLKEAEFRELVRVLARELADRFPHVQFNNTPRRGD